MGHFSTNEEATRKKTREFFDFIIQPYQLIKIFSINDLLSSSEPEQLKDLIRFFKERNLDCYKLEGKKKNSIWEIFYVDQDIPVLFYPITHELIAFDIFHSFTSIVTAIKRNLLNYYSQKTEAIFISINKRDIDNRFDLYKLEDQDQPNNRNNELKLRQKKRRIPVGQRNPKNKLNFLTGREWIKFTKSWFILRPPARKEEEFLHPAKFPETMIRQFITFFTKPGEFVVDPFLGTGSTLISAKQCNRNGIGIELEERYANISKNRLKVLGELEYPPLYQTKDPCNWEVICGDSKKLLEYWDEFEYPMIDFSITSPPYWNQLERNSIRQKDRKERGFDTKYSNNYESDLGNIHDYSLFLTELQKIFGNVYELLKPKGYLVVITNNVFVGGKLFPLAFDTVSSLIQDNDHPWVLKDEKIWLQDDKRLVALGVNYAWVGNRCHQYCLIFRKER